MKYIFTILLINLSLVFFAKNNTEDPKDTTETIKSKKTKQGKASWYGPGFHGKKTANGEIYNMHGLTCATTWNPTTRRLGIPLGTKIKVTNLNNNKSVIVKVNDTGSFSKYGRVLDLSKGAFSKIASINKGVINIKYEILR